MRVRSGIALLVVCLVALNLPQASAGRRRYKRRCDLVGCQQCYTTPSKTCYSRICQELYGCEENKCGSGYIYNEGSGMCDCKEGHGIVLGRCSYKPYKRMPQFSPYYAGLMGYNKLSQKSYKARSKGYGPGAYGYRPGMYVSGPYCQLCPTGYTSLGGEPLTTFCMPGGSLGTLKVSTPPAGKEEPFDVEVTFNVPGGCGSLKTFDVLVGSNPPGISCEAAEVDDSCAAVTSCKFDKAGAFKLRAQLQGVAGIATESVDVVVPDEEGPSVTVTINTNFKSLTEEERQALGNEVKERLNAALSSTGGSFRLKSVTEGSVAVNLGGQGTLAQIAALLAGMPAAWALTIPLVLGYLAGQGITNPDGTALTPTDLGLTWNGQVITPTPTGAPAVVLAINVNLAALTGIQQTALWTVARNALNDRLTATGAALEFVSISGGTIAINYRVVGSTPLQVAALLAALPAAWSPVRPTLTSYVRQQAVTPVGRPVAVEDLTLSVNGQVVPDPNPGPLPPPSGTFRQLIVVATARVDTTTSLSTDAARSAAEDAMVRAANLRIRAISPGFNLVVIEAVTITPGPDPTRIRFTIIVYGSSSTVDLLQVQIQLPTNANFLRLAIWQGLGATPGAYTINFLAS